MAHGRYISDRPSIVCEYEPIEIAETPAFVAYELMVLAMVKANPDSSIADIHRSLGDAARPAWTMLALERMVNIHSRQAGALQRYSYIEPERRKKVLIDSDKQKEWTAHQRRKGAAYPTYSWSNHGGRLS